jgi:hypothetical protein
LKRLEKTWIMGKPIKIRRWTRDSPAVFTADQPRKKKGYPRKGE